MSMVNPQIGGTRPFPRCSRRSVSCAHQGWLRSRTSCVKRLSSGVTRVATHSSATIVMATMAKPDSKPDSKASKRSVFASSFWRVTTKIVGWSSLALMAIDRLSTSLSVAATMPSAVAIPAAVRVAASLPRAASVSTMRCPAFVMCGATSLSCP